MDLLTTIQYMIHGSITLNGSRAGLPSLTSEKLTDLLFYFICLCLTWIVPWHFLLDRTCASDLLLSIQCIYFLLFAIVMLSLAERFGLRWCVSIDFLKCSHKAFLPSLSVGLEGGDWKREKAIWAQQAKQNGE